MRRDVQIIARRSAINMVLAATMPNKLICLRSLTRDPASMAIVITTAKTYDETLPSSATSLRVSEKTVPDLCAYCTSGDCIQSNRASH